MSKPKLHPIWGLNKKKMSYYGSRGVVFNEEDKDWTFWQIAEVDKICGGQSLKGNFVYQEKAALDERIKLCRIAFATHPRLRSHCWTQQELSFCYGTTRQTVKNIERSAIRKIKIKLEKINKELGNK